MYYVNPKFMNTSIFFDFDILIVYLPITCEIKPQKNASYTVWAISNSKLINNIITAEIGLQTESNHVLPFRNTMMAILYYDPTRKNRK